jgi:hypothetical protein
VYRLAVGKDTLFYSQESALELGRGMFTSILIATSADNKRYRNLYSKYENFCDRQMLGSSLTRTPSLTGNTPGFRLMFAGCGNDDIVL